jgi:tetratricopeptide (TPR) repeat protein
MCLLEFTDKDHALASAGPEQSYKKALLHIQQAVNLNPSPEYLAIQATLLFRLNDFLASSKAFELALSLKPEQQLRANILNNYACLLSQMGQKDKALKIFDELETDNSYLTPQAALFNKGKIFFEENNFDIAAKEFSKAINKATDFLDARYYLALSAFKTNNITLAKNEIQTILFLEPEHEGAKQLSEQMKKESVHMDSTSSPRTDSSQAVRPEPVEGLHERLKPQRRS